MPDRLWPLQRDYVCPTLIVRGREFAWGTRTFVMGIINVTPDSFSGDGTGGDVAAAVAQAQAFSAAGADMLDVGGESTRPDAQPVSPEEETRRVVPASRAIRAETDLPISVDTMHASVAAAGLDAGAHMVNDVSGLRGDGGVAAVVAERGVPVIAMHNQRGRAFHDVVDDIREGVDATLEVARCAGIALGRVVLDPGFGFGWSPEQNLEMLRRLPELWDLRLPLLVGVSRKSTLGFVTGAPVDERLLATAAAVTLSIAGGADIVRVHDVGEMRQVVSVADAVARGNWTKT